ncbi:hypothetical protein IIC68_00040 [archaeon]|nr:hypothetical protein [archaeon]
MIALGVASLPITSTFLVIAGAIAAVITISVILFKKWDVIKKFFKENPFAQTAKFLFFLLTPLGQVIAFVKLLVAAFKGLDAIKNVARDILPKFLADKLFGKEKFGAEKGARTTNKKIGQNKTDNFSGVLDINFRNAPEGTNIKSKTQGPLEFNLGFAGGLQ